MNANQYFVEVEVKRSCRIPTTDAPYLRAVLDEYLENRFLPRRKFVRLSKCQDVVGNDAKICEMFNRLLVTEGATSSNNDKSAGDHNQAQSSHFTRAEYGSAEWRFYRNSAAEPTQHAIALSEDETPVVGSNQWELPNEEFDDLWEQLIYESNIKEEVLNYVHSMFMLSANRVNCSVIAVNRLVLFHGPPGTGKTSLCKALAQRVAVRLNQTYKRGVLVEVNSHSLFSKWFSESGKLVAELFDSINTLLLDEQCMVCVLIDEVESLSMARDGAVSRNEPSDAVRVVNALLTQIDNIRRHPNALIFTTSNLSSAVDAAFIDRADIKRLIPPPPASVIYRILGSIVDEMQRIGVLSSAMTLLDWEQLQPTASQPSDEHSSAVVSQRLVDIARKSVGLSGRALRKLPVIAFAEFLHMNVRLDLFVEALSRTVDKELGDRGCMKAA